MKAVKIGSQWWIVREAPETKRGFTVVDGPYPEEWQAVSASRVNETWESCEEKEELAGKRAEA